MEGIKFIASQAKSIHHYKSLRSKILKCNANIFFNLYVICCSSYGPDDGLSWLKHVVLLNFIEDVL